jgi:diguanylate cyclase (GGDEF)-like protein
MRKLRVIFFAFAFLLILSCKKDIDQSDEPLIYKSFRDIPGVTSEEILAIEKLQKERKVFSYGMTMSTEAFLKENGEVGGYAALFCQWLTELFGIQFQPKIYAWSYLIENLNAGNLDFAGNLIISEERKKIYHMTDAIAERQYKMLRLKGSRSLDKIALERLPRYAFLLGAAHGQNVAYTTPPDTYEAIFIGDYADVYNILESGAADAFIAEDIIEASFSAYKNLYIEDFLPLIFSSIAMATAKAEFEAVISVIAKAQRNGIMPHLNHLFNQGYEEYKKHKFFTNLNEEEKAYLQKNDTVPLLYQYFNYPIAFYDFRSKKWAGISIDILREVEKLTGLVFEVVNSEQTEMPELIDMLSTGKGHIFADLIFTKERSPHFIWNRNKFMADQYALLSKFEYPNVSISEIPYKRIALIKSTAHEEMFRIWFPNAVYATTYPNSDEAFIALEQDEVDMVMVSKSKLLWYSNYYEFSGYKANFLFNHFYESAFSFNKEQTVLCSIVDKAVSVIKTSMITEQWITKTYDFRTRLITVQRPWLIGTVLAALVLILVLLYRSRSEEKRLERLVQKRTAQLNEQRKLLEYMSLTDQLTGLPNRRNFDMRLDIEWRIAVREKQKISFMMIDIDFFKKYNDQYGHQQGDEVLRMIAKTIEHTPKRPGDFVARWGGEEFAVLLSNTGTNGALKIAEDIRSNVENMNMLLANGSVAKLTISIGVNAQTPEPGDSLETFISLADKELYKAKETGRNRVCCFSM